jgi:plastocyanin
MKYRFCAGFLLFAAFLCSCAVGDPRKMAQTDIQIIIDNYSFTPQRWIVPSGEIIHIKVDNPSGGFHTLVILKGHTVMESNPRIKANQYWSITIDQTGSEETFRAPAMPGEYQIVCAQADHQEKGERGIFIVVIP